MYQQLRHINTILDIFLHGIRALFSYLKGGGGRKRTFKVLAMTKKEDQNDKNQGFVITHQSPYYLSSSNSPGALITAIKFDGKNYDLWEQAVRTAFKAKNKLGFIDGKITKPTVTEGE